MPNCWHSLVRRCSRRLRRCPVKRAKRWRPWWSGAKWSPCAPSNQFNRRLSASPTVQAHLDQHLAWLDAEIAALEQEISDFIQQNLAWAAKDGILQSVPGVGQVTARTLLAALPELGAIDRKKIAALVGGGTVQS